MDGLIIKEPWIELILQGKKIWEIRSSTTHKRGKIALIKSKSGHVYGTVDLVDCLFLTHDEYRISTQYHKIKYEDTEAYPYKKTYAWVLSNPILFDKPIPYKHPSGAVIWVKLGDLLSDN